jgi:uncharacterized membrane protein YvbJ
VYCPKCGAQNDDTATFCASCGAPLPQSAATPAQSSLPPSQAPVASRSAIVAAIANLFWGLGYLYLGYKKVLGIPSIGFVAVMFILYVVLGFFTFGILSLLIAIALAIDGYQKGSGQKGFVDAQK